MNGDKPNSRTAPPCPWHYNRGPIFAPGTWAQIGSQKREARQSAFKLLEPLSGPKKTGPKKTGPHSLAAAMPLKNIHRGHQEGTLDRQSPASLILGSRGCAPSPSFALRLPLRVITNAYLHHHVAAPTELALRVMHAVILSQPPCGHASVPKLLTNDEEPYHNFRNGHVHLDLIEHLASRITTACGNTV